MQNQAHRVSKIPKPRSKSTPSPRAVRQRRLTPYSHPNGGAARGRRAGGNLAEIPPALTRENPRRSPPERNEKARARVEKPDPASLADRCPSPHQSRGRHTLSSRPLPTVPSPPLPLARRGRRPGGTAGRKKRLRDFCGTPTPPLSTPPPPPPPPGSS
ncbi:hypothetical protein BS78_06G140400 [Paspalum vaginatum]|nr:hypothetical protein BS78_06G140400 [Paspalum vaginatum]